MTDSAGHVEMAMVRRPAGRGAWWLSLGLFVLLVNASFLFYKSLLSYHGPYMMLEARGWLYWLGTTLVGVVLCVAGMCRMVQGTLHREDEQAVMGRNVMWAAGMAFAGLGVMILLTMTYGVTVDWLPRRWKMLPYRASVMLSVLSVWAVVMEGLRLLAWRDRALGCVGLKRWTVAWRWLAIVMGPGVVLWGYWFWDIAVTSSWGRDPLWLGMSAGLLGYGWTVLVLLRVHAAVWARRGFEQGKVSDEVCLDFMSRTTRATKLEA